MAPTRHRRTALATAPRTARLRRCRRARGTALGRTACTARRTDRTFAAPLRRQNARRGRSDADIASIELDRRRKQLFAACRIRQLKLTDQVVVERHFQRFGIPAQEPGRQQIAAGKFSRAGPVDSPDADAARVEQPGGSRTQPECDNFRHVVRPKKRSPDARCGHPEERVRDFGRWRLGSVI